MEPSQHLPFDDMTGCVRLSNGLDGVIWIVDGIIALKTPIDYDGATAPVHQDDIQQSQESRASIEWEKTIFSFLNKRNSSFLVKSYHHVEEGIFMEYIPGGNLEERIKINEPMTTTQKFHLIRQLIAVVTELTRLGLAHGDLRPQNFLLDPSGRLKCCDFAATVQLGKPYRRMPWPLYIKPQSTDFMIADEPGQAYSIAISIYFVVTGHQPYHDKPLHEAIRLFREGIYPPMYNDEFKSLLPVAEIVRKCWRGDYNDIIALEADIERAGETLVIQYDISQRITRDIQPDLQHGRERCEAFLSKRRRKCHGGQYCGT